jgi:hypothetical protein
MVIFMDSSAPKKAIDERCGVIRELGHSLAKPIDFTGMIAYTHGSVNAFPAIARRLTLSAFTITSRRENPQALRLAQHVLCS